MTRVRSAIDRTAAMSPWKTSLICSAVVLTLCVGLVQWYYQSTLNAVCEKGSESAQAIVDIGAVFSQDSKIPDDADPELRATMERNNQRKADARAIVRDISEPDPCADGVTPPSKAGDYQLDEP